MNSLEIRLDFICLGYLFDNPPLSLNTSARVMRAGDGNRVAKGLIMNTNKKAVGVAGKAAALLTALLLLASAAPAQAATATKTYEYGYATPTECAATAGARSCMHHIVYRYRGYVPVDSFGKWASTYSTSSAPNYGWPIAFYEGLGIGAQVK